MRIIAIIIVFMSMTFILRAEEPIKIIEKVNSRIITSQDLSDYVKTLSLQLSDREVKGSDVGEKFKRAALQRLINDKLVLDEAKKEIADIPASWVDKRFNQVLSSYSSREEFEKSLLEKGLNNSIFREKIKEQYFMREIIERRVKSRVSVLPQEISRYYADNNDKFFADSAYVFYIAKSDKESILDRISVLIERNGIHEASQMHDEILNKVESTREELKEEMFEAINRLSEGEQQLIRIDDLFYLIYLEKIKQRQLIPLEKVKEDIKVYIWENKFKIEFTKWINDLRENAVIKNYYE